MGTEIGKGGDLVLSLRRIDDGISFDCDVNKGGTSVTGVCVERVYAVSGISADANADEEGARVSSDDDVDTSRCGIDGVGVDVDVSV